MRKTIATIDPEGVTYTTPAEGNVFADLDLPDPELLLLKSGMQRTVVNMVKARGLTQDEAAKLLGMRQPHVSKLLAGKFDAITLDRLVKCLMALGAEMMVQITPPAHAGARGRARIKLPPSVPEKVAAKMRQTPAKGRAVAEALAEASTKAPRTAKA
jgi:predicted XRE-type DNA-binding protein